MILLTGGLLFVAVGAEVGFGNWIYTYALHQELADESAGRLMTSAFWGAFTFARLLAIPLAARWTPVSILLLCFGVAGVATLLPLTSTGEVAWLWAAAILGGIAVAPMFATTLSLAGDRMPISGRAMGWFFVGSSAGGMTIPWVIGQLFEPVSPQAMLWVILIDIGFGLGIWTLLWRGRRDLGRT